MAISKATNSMPSWVSAPDPSMGYMQALTDLTNPTTGETWTAPHGGYSVRPTPTPQATGGVDLGQRLPAPDFNMSPAVLPTTQQIQTPWGGMKDIEPVWADSFDWNTATLADAHRKLSTDKYGMVNYAKYSDADAQRLLDSERSSMASTQQPAPQATGGKGVGDVVSAQPQTTGQNFFPQATTYPYQPQQQVAAQSAPSLMQATAGNRSGQPYQYGNLGLNTSDYSIWGSKGNPYYYVGNSYNPANWAHPIVPQPIAPAPVGGGSGGSDYDPSTGGGISEEQQYDNLQSWIDRDKDMTRGALGMFGLPLVDPAIDLMYGINPYTQKSLSWYDGSTDFDNNVYSDRNLGRDFYSGTLSAYQMDKEAGMTDQTWSEYYNEAKADRAAADATGVREPSWYDSMWSDPTSATAAESDMLVQNVADQRAIAYAASVAERQRAENPAQAVADANYVGTAADGYAATAKRYGTTPGSEQTAMLAEQDMGMSSPTVADSIEAGVPFGKEGDDTWSPNGKDVYHGSGHNWNTPDSKNTAPVGTITPPSSGGGSSDEAGSASDSNMADAGFSQEDQDFIDSGFDDDDSGGGDSGGGGGGGSYIATAATQALGTEGLQVFNNWRDYMSTWHPTFTTSYGRYRVTAPKIVAEIDKKENSKELYREIWDKHLKPIFELIKEDKDNPKALSDYKVMVKELMNKYLKAGEK